MVACALVIVLIALVLRATGLDWDRRRLMHPDERFMVMTTAALDVPSGIGEYLDGPNSPLNPRRGGASFAYGSLPLTLARLAVGETGRPPLADVVVTGRWISVLADMCTLLVLGWLTRRLYDASTALIAMALYACAVLSIQHSHFFVVDPLLTLWCTVAVAALAILHQRARWTAAAMAGIGTALAVACKLTGGLLVLPALVVLACHVAGPRLTGRARTPWATVLTCAAVYALACLVSIRLAAPDMFTGQWLPWPGRPWLDDVRQITLLSSGAIDTPPAFQWADRTRGWFPWWNLVRYGLGPPLGLVATVATIAAVWRALGCWHSRCVVPAAWVVVVAVVVGTSFVSSMRYLLPIYPTSCLLGAWLLMGAYRRSASLGPRWLQPAAAGAIAFVVVSTAVWALAFTSIYRELHPRLAASRWIFDSVPAGAVLTAEAWDDPLPYSASRQTHASRYTILTLPVTNEDSPAKVDALVEGLERAAFVVLSSNRIAETIVRLPRRFPVMVRYYEALADGRLGFDLVAEFRSVPRIGRWTWPDAAAEEAFTVYDHPHVRIFRKRDGWSRDDAHALLGGVDWSAQVHVTTRAVSLAPTLLELSPRQQMQLEASGTWREGLGVGGRFGATPVSGIDAGIRWLGVLLLISVLAWPACAVVLPGTWGRGLLVAPPLGLLWTGWVAWLWGTVSPWPVTTPVLAGAMASLAVCSIALAWPTRTALRQWLVTHRRLVALQLTALAGLGILGVAMRALNPDLWHPTLGGEKPMDIAILSALVRADHFPAFDPWFAGGVLNYYYFGFVPVAVLCRLTGIEPAVAYTLAVGTWWALTAGGVAIVAGTLVDRLGLSARPARAAVIAAMLAVASGNLRQLELVWRWFTGSVPQWTWYWHASRGIPVPEGEVPPITEFPYFTVLFADLHAHLLAMPWMLAVVLVSVQIVLCRATATWCATPLLILGGALVGVLAATNAWDVPTALALIAGATTVQAWWSTAPADRQVDVRRWTVQLAIVVLSAAVAAWPFWSVYAAPAGGIGLWRGARSPWWALLLIHGPFLMVLGPALVALVAFWRRPPASGLGPLHAWLGGLAVLGLVLVVAVELFVVGGDVGRMNTVFKSYLQVWLVWSCAIPAAWMLVRAWLREQHPHRSGVRRAFTAVTCVAGTLMLAYPLTATLPRLNDRMAPEAPRGLDGTTFMTHARLATPLGSYMLDEDRRVIRWLLDHVAGTPTIVEAQTDQYQWGGRISAHTGLPTVLGWTWHARQQRMALPASLVGRRRRDVRTFYSTSSADEAWQLAHRYDVRYVVVGALERQLYPDEGLSKFALDPRWTPVFSSNRTYVYARGE